MDILCLEFINSKWYKSHQLFKDPLLDQNWIDNFCAKWHLSKTSISNAEDMKMLIDLRSFLSRIANDVCKTGMISKADLNKLNKYLSSSKFYNKLALENGRYHLNTISEQPNIKLFTCKIVLSFANLLTQYDIERIKLCQNPKCGWIFYDESKGGTRKWCDNTCASLMKVRRFRETKKKNMHGLV